MYYFTEQTALLVGMCCALHMLEVKVESDLMKPWLVNYHSFNVHLRNCDECNPDNYEIAQEE